MSNTHDNEDQSDETSAFAREPWDILRDAGYTEEADAIEEAEYQDRGDRRRKNRCTDGACSIVTDPDGSPDHPEEVNG